ncbi:MAG: hypothetical protein IKE31_06580, partial [Eubacterium sp.]|nr:hypothetical protein [Eubacterium sp.]
QKIGIGITDVAIASVSYPEEVQAMLEKAASQSMIGNINTYQQVAMADALSNPSSAAGSAAATMARLGAGMAMAQQMTGQAAPAEQNQNAAAAPSAAGVNFCPNCGTPASGARFCPNCGTQLMQ